MKASLVQVLFEPPIARLVELKHDLVSLKTRTSNSKIESTYLTLIAALIDCGIEKARSDLAKLTDMGEPEDRIVDIALDTLKEGVLYVDDVMHSIQKSHPIGLPLGSEGLVKDVFSRVSREKLHFYLNVNFRHDYSTSPDEYGRIKHKIEVFFGKTIPEECANKKVVNINLYWTQARDILRHSILAHEAGHVLVQVDDRFAEGLQNFQEILREKVEKLIEEFTADDVGEEKFQIENKISETYASWMEEFFVDLVSIHALGPAAFFSMKELILEETDVLDSAGDRHPPITMRLVMMYLALESLGFLKVMDTKIKATCDAVIEWCDSFQVFGQGDPMLEQLSALIDKPVLQKMVKTFLKMNFDGQYSLGEFQKQVPPLMDYFRAGIATVEILSKDGKSLDGVSCSSVLNAAWAIQELKSLGTETLNPILNKSLSNLYLKRQWDMAGAGK